VNLNFKKNSSPLTEKHFFSPVCPGHTCFPSFAALTAAASPQADLASAAKGEFSCRRHSISLESSGLLFRFPSFLKRGFVIQREKTCESRLHVRNYNVSVQF